VLAEVAVVESVSRVQIVDATVAGVFWRTHLVVRYVKMVIRKGILTLDQWNERITELLQDIGKEQNELALEAYDLVISRALDFKDAREEDIEDANRII
jgi:hypothetical protein